MTIFNETKQRFQEITDDLLYGVVGYTCEIIEYGWFERFEEHVLVLINGRKIPALSRNLNLYYNRFSGYYTFTPNDVLRFGYGDFPYNFTRYYSTRYLEDMFEEYHSPNNIIQFKYIEELPYSFGLEFETHSGYIPQDVVFKTGLIPLRDGSINGLEYSTIVLKGNDGFNTLKTMIEILKEYTIFDKECSLHVHFGSWNLDPKVILRLNNLFAGSDINRYLCDFAFNTEKYKANGKSYCKKNVARKSFDSLYYSLTDRPYLGDLYQPHPRDLTGNQKWKVTTRYTALNLINAICYENAKTAEFRCLRPTYNFDKIICWIFILGAYIKYAENYKLKKTSQLSLETIISAVYSEDLTNVLLRFLKIQEEVIVVQRSLYDYYSGRVDVEDQMITYKNVSKNCKYFY